MSGITWCEPYIDTRFRYDEIRDLYIKQLAFTLIEDSTTGVTCASVKKKIEDFAGEEFEHATEIGFALLKILNEDGDVTSPADASSAVSLTKFCLLLGMILSAPTPQHKIPVKVTTHWASVKAALVRSIHTGTFFDKKYWARHCKSGDVLKPVYFSSIIMNDKARQFNKRTSRFGHLCGAVLSVPSGEMPQRSKSFCR